jgi:hypothetical protein
MLIRLFTQVTVVSNHFRIVLLLCCLELLMICQRYRIALRYGVIMSNNSSLHGICMPNYEPEMTFTYACNCDRPFQDQFVASDPLI